jgi:phosphatidate cytidylyltransferase
MLTRAITGAVYVAVIVLSIYFGGLVLQATFGVLTLFMLVEFYKMFSKSPYSPNLFIGTLFGLTLYGIGCYVVSNPNILTLGPYILSGLILFIAVFVVLGIAELYRKKEHPVVNMGITVAGMSYIVIPMVLISAIQQIGIESSRDSVFPLLAIFIMVWCSDTFAYLIGKKFGKNKMFERISPNKTWEGFVGGTVFSVIAGVIIALFLNEQPFLFYGILGLIVAVFGTLGDLIESMFKRSLGLKDSGTILPGHGGLLDRLDSILIAVPVSFIFYISFLMS